MKRAGCCSSSWRSSSLIAGLLVVQIVRPAWYVASIAGVDRASHVSAQPQCDHRLRRRASTGSTRRSWPPSSTRRAASPECGLGAGRHGPHAGAPGDGREIARKTGGDKFVVGDYRGRGSISCTACNYLRYLLDQFGGSTSAAVAAYNAGGRPMAAVDRGGQGCGGPCAVADIPSPRRAVYVDHVSLYATVYRRALRRRAWRGAGRFRGDPLSGRAHVGHGRGRPVACEHTFVCVDSMA